MMLSAPYGVTSSSSLQGFQAFGYMFTWGLFLWALFLFTGVQLHETETLALISMFINCTK